MAAGHEDTSMDVEQLAIDFYNGAGALHRLSAWGRVMAEPQAICELVPKLERAFTELARLQNEGKINNVAALSSTETLEAIRRINDLIKMGLDGPLALQHAGEIHTLAEQCLQTLKSDPATVATIRARETPMP